MKREMSSVVSQVPGFGRGESQKRFPIPSAPGVSVFDDITAARASGSESCPMFYACRCVFFLCIVARRNKGLNI